MNQLTDNNIPIKQYIDILKKQKKKLKEDFVQSNADLHQIQLEVTELENQMGKNDEFELKFLLVEIARIESEMRYLNKKDQAENVFLRNQLKNLYDSKFKITQNQQLIEEKLRRADREIGFRQQGGEGRD